MQEFLKYIDVYKEEYRTENTKMEGADEGCRLVDEGGQEEAVNKNLDKLSINKKNLVISWMKKNSFLVFDGNSLYTSAMFDKVIKIHIILKLKRDIY